MKRTVLIMTALVCAASIIHAEPRPWTLSNLDPDGTGTPIYDLNGQRLTGTFPIQLVYDADGDGPDPVIDNGPNIGQPGGDDVLVTSILQTAPSENIVPAGAFYLTLTWDPDVVNYPGDASFYVRAYRNQNFVLGARYDVSVTFPLPIYPGSAQTVAAFSGRMAGYIGNNSPNVVVTPEEPTVLAGELLQLTVEVSDDEATTVTVPADGLPGGEQSVLINEFDETTFVVRWAIPLDAEGEHDLLVVVSDGDLSSRVTVPVTVLGAEDRPSAFQPLAPANDGTAWDGGVTIWQPSVHPDNLDITYTFIWAINAQFNNADSVTGLTEPGVNLHFVEQAARPARGNELVALGQNRSRNGKSQPVSDDGRKRRNLVADDGSASAVGPDTPEIGRQRRQLFLAPGPGAEPLTDDWTRDFPIYTQIETGTTYYWKVRAVASDATDRYSPAQSAVAEIPDAPQAFNLLEPANGATLVTVAPRFRWRTAADPDIGDTLTYDLLWSADGGVTVDTIAAIPDTVFDMSGEELDFAGVDRLRTWLLGEAERQHAARAAQLAAAPQPGRDPAELGALTRSPFRIQTPVMRTVSAENASSLVSPGKSGRSLTTRTLLPVPKPDVPLPHTLLPAGIGGAQPGPGWQPGNGAAIPGAPVADDVPDHSEITWRVEVIDATGNRVACNGIRTFTVDAPDVPGGFDAVSPADSLFVHELQDVTVTWTESTDNDPGQDAAYDLLATHNPADTDPAAFPVIAAGLTETAYPLPCGDEDDLEWRWTVRAVSAGDTTWMNGGPLHLFVSRIDPPAEFALVHPDDGGQVPATTPELEWEASSDTDLFDSFRYTLYWSRDNWSSQDSTSGLDTTVYTLDIGLEDNSDLWWRVRAVDTNTSGRWADPAEGYHFTVILDDPPAAFALLAPQDGFIVDTPTFDMVWRASEDPENAGDVTYSIEISDDAGFTDPLVLDAGTDTSFAVDSATLAENIYWWRVIAHDATGMNTTSTQTWTFTQDYSYVSEWNEGVPVEYAIARAYPNPFNPVLTVVLASPKPNSFVELTLHDILGRVVVKRTWKPLAPGYMPISIDMTGHSSGSYFIRMHADGRSIATQRVTLLK